MQARENKEYVLAKTGYKVRLEDEYRGGNIGGSKDSCTLRSGKETNIVFMISDLIGYGENVTNTRTLKSFLKEEIGDGEEDSREIKIEEGELLFQEAVVLVQEMKNGFYAKKVTTIFDDLEYSVAISGRDKEEFERAYKNVTETLTKA